MMLGFSKWLYQWVLGFTVLINLLEDGLDADSRSVGLSQEPEVQMLPMLLGRGPRLTEENRPLS